MAAAGTADCVLAFYDTRCGGYWPERLVRPGSGHWEGIVHEYWVRPAGGYPLSAAIADPEAFHVRHAGGRGSRRKYLPLLQEATTDLRRTPRAFLLLAKDLLWAGENEAAVHALITYLSEGHDLVEGPWNERRLLAYDLLRDACLRLSLPDLARRAEARRDDYLTAWLAEAEHGRAPDLRVLLTQKAILAELRRRYMQQRGRAWRAATAAPRPYSSCVRGRFHGPPWEDVARSGRVYHKTAVSALNDFVHDQRACLGLDHLAPLRPLIEIDVGAN